MLGRTHAITTTSTGLLGIYGLYRLTESVSTDVWYGSLGHKFVDMVGLNFELVGFPLVFALVVCTLGLLFGSLLPDIDSKRSILGRYVPFVEEIIGHRTYTHTIWVVAILSGAAYYFGYTFLWMIVLGYIMHIIQDSLSIQGVDWLYPFGKGYKSYAGGASVKRGFHIGLYRVGGIIENIIGVMMVLLMFYMVYVWGSIAFF